MSTARNFWLIAVSMVAAALMVGVVIVPAASASENCENEARRVEQASTFLPDCRAYELVSQLYQPSPTSGVYSAGFPPTNVALLSPAEPRRLPEIQYDILIAQDGNAALFGSFESNSESDAHKSNLSRRGPNGWSGENVIPRVSRHGFLCDPAKYVGFSPNFDEVAVSIGISENVEGSAEDCGHAEPELVAGEPQKSANLFLRNSATRTFQLINVTPPGTMSYDPYLVAISADGSHVVFLSRARLTTNALDDATSREETEGHCTTSDFGNVYAWLAGEVHLVTVLPDGKPVRGTVAGGHPRECGRAPDESAGFAHSVSTDGERILFYAGGVFRPVRESFLSPTAPYSEGGLYLREHPGAEQSQLNSAGECTEPEKACTIQIDTTQGGAGKSGNGQFQWASADTSKVFFTDEEQLTPDSTAAAGKPDLYEYNLEKPQGQRLTDLTANASEPADVLGVSGASEDGSYLYFVAKGNLTGSQENSHNAKAVAGEANLYLRHGATTTFIAALNAEGGDQCDWTAWCLTSRVSQNGLFIAFDSIDGLTGYDNHPVHPEACQHLTEVTESPCIEAFRYAAGAGEHGELTCATCNPSGAPPAAEFAWSVIEQAGREGSENEQIELNDAVSNSGQVFFETMEKLVPADENETWDIYEYDGGEGPSAQLHLISTGKNELPSYFVSATPDGSNVFFTTDQSLLRADIRSDYDLYDARVGGGFISQSEAVQPPSCEAVEACRSPLTEPPAEFSAASAALVGAGNLTPAPEQPEVKTPAKKLTRKQQLELALKACTKRYHEPKRRHSCERQAHGRYGAKASRAHPSNGRAGK